MAFDLTLVLWFSVLLQLIAAGMALRLIPATGHTLAWSILSVAFILMATRRTISLLHQQGMIESQWLTAMSTETVALMISIMIVVGVYLIRDVFIKKRQDEDELLKLSQVVEQNSSSTIITDLEGKIEYVNQKFTEKTGYAFDEVKGKTSSFLNAKKTRHEVFLNMWKTIQSGKVWVGEFCNQSKSGSLSWEKARVSPVKDANDVTTHYVAVLEDVTEQKAQREALEYMAMHDALTDLPNRALFYDRVYQGILNAEHSHSAAAIMLMDLNQFKVINDTLGHHIGDRILKEVAKRVLKAVKTYDTVARMGGDEYLVLLQDVDEEQTMLIAKRLIEVIKTPFSIDSHQFDIGVSIGIAMYPQHGDDPDMLIKRADVAMYSAKGLTEHIAVYDPDLDDYSVGQLELLGEIRSALDQEQEQFVVHYQPRINLNNMSICGAEALIRWQHPQQGMLFPDTFIPLLEETGHITILTRWILAKALAQLQNWLRIDPDFVMSINISTRDLCDQSLVDHIDSLLTEHEIHPRHIMLELTESSLMQYSRYTQSTLEQLEKIGIRLAIDDYGTGYSSLQYLKQLPVSELKIDKSFVMDMLEDENDAVIVKSTIDLAHNLGLEVVAEGVENEEVSDFLKILNCSQAQGYYFSRPVDAPAMEKLMIEEAAADNVTILKNSEIS